MAGANLAIAHDRGETPSQHQLELTVLCGAEERSVTVNMASDN